MSISDELASLTVSHDDFAFHPSSGDSYVLNQPALAIIQGRQDGTDESQLAGDLAEQFDIDQATTFRDVSDLVLRFRSMDLM